MLQNVKAKVGNYLSLVKFAHTVFALPFALIGYFMATVQEGGILSWNIFILVIACMFLARNAAMSFNRWADREFDRQNPRTAKREIPADIIKPSYALAFCLANAALFIVATWFINPICFYLSPVALMVILGYSLTKRFTSLSHMVLGLGLSLAPTGAYLAVCGHFGIQPVLLSLAVLCWVTGFDIIYALQDEDFDREFKLKSIPVALGRRKSLGFSLLLHLLTTVFLLFAGITGEFRTIYWVGFIIFNFLLYYQHWIVKPDDLSKVNLAFFTLNGIASLLFATFSIADLLIRI
ncbi:MAG: UbiA family prenyltransferase [Bacteroidetes bacterium]|nr:UbiA family prenyltransferase [Bacteroidota bacterium]